ncbi:hypothetical protein T02_13865, partial [Trichinella nativa]
LSGLVRHPNRVINAFVAKGRRAGVDWLVSLRGHLCWLPAALLLLPLSSRFPDDIIPNRRRAESIVFIINYEQRESTKRHRKLGKPTITTRSLRATHYRNPSLIFRYISSYGSFFFTYKSRKPGDCQQDNGGIEFQLTHPGAPLRRNVSIYGSGGDHPGSYQADERVV